MMGETEISTMEEQLNLMMRKKVKHAQNTNSAPEIVQKAVHYLPFQNVRTVISLKQIRKVAASQPYEIEPNLDTIVIGLSKCCLSHNLQLVEISLLVINDVFFGMLQCRDRTKLLTNIFHSSWDEVGASPSVVDSVTSGACRFFWKHRRCCTYVAFNGL